MRAYILLDIQTGQIPQVVRHLQRLEHVVEASMTFGPYDAVAVVEVGDIGELGSIMSLDIQTIPGVRETLTCLAVDV